MAKELHLAPSNISKYENRKLQPNIEQINEISDYFGVSTDYLLGKTYKKEITASESNTELIEKVIDTLSFNNYGHFLVSKKEQEMIKNIRQLPQEEINKILGMIEIKLYELNLKKNESHQ